MLNNNDWHYILRRLVIFVLISIAMFLIGIFKAHALTTDTIYLGNSPTIVSQTNNNVYQMSGRGANFNGWVYFTAVSVPYNNAPTQPLKSVYINATNQSWYCDLGNAVSYNDNNKQYITYSVKCPINTTTTGISSIVFEQFNNGMAIFLSNNMQFYSDEATNSSGQISQAYMDEFLRILRADLGTILTAINNTNSNTTIQNATSTITNQIQQQATQQHQDAQQINDTINDSSVDTTSAGSTFSDLDNSMSSNGTISSLITMPITLLQKLLNGLIGNCSAYPIGSIFGYNMSFECINPSNYIGSVLWNVIDVICAGFIAYKLGKRFVVIFNQLTNLKDGGLESAYD